LLRQLLLVPLAVALLATTGCGSKHAPEAGAAPSPTPSPTPASTPAEPAPASAAPATGSPAAGASTVTVTLTDFEIELSNTSLTAGTYTFVIDQQGQHPHALSIKGPGVDTVSMPTVQPGGRGQPLTVTLRPGRYELWCPVDNHRGQGMNTTITVQ